MCNSSNCSHNDLNDDLDDLLGEGPSRANLPEQVSPVELRKDGDLADAPMRVSHETRAASAGHRYTEKCTAAGCRNGTFYGYTGRPLGRCFTCKGTGVQTFKTSPEAREKARIANERKREQKEASLRENAATWKVENADDWAWMQAKAGSFDFAASMVDALRSYGCLTDKQHAAVVRLREKDAIRQAEWAAEKLARETNAPAVDVSQLEKAFSTAQEKGLKRPKVFLAGYKFSLAPLTGRNAGALYVTHKASDQYLGKIMDGKFSRVRECTSEQEAEIVAVASDPHNAAIAYGQRTGQCSCCGRELTNHASIDLGIGPICAEKYGWA